LSDEEMTFLAAIRANPSDDLNRLVYADWLDERGKGPKAEFLRIVAHLHQLYARMEEIRPTLSVGWTSEVTPHCRVVILRVPSRGNLAGAVRVIRDELDGPDSEARVIAGSAPSVVAMRMPFEGAVTLAKRLSAFAEVSIHGVA
jgi:uncharacterized protein (TIGR02996 family)